MSFGNLNGNGEIEYSEAEAEDTVYAFNFWGEFITDMNRGTLTVISGKIAKSSPKAMKIKTPTTILGLRGTKIAVQVKE